MQKRIQSLDRELGIEVTDFFGLGNWIIRYNPPLLYFFIELFGDNYNGCIEIIKIQKWDLSMT